MKYRSDIDGIRALAVLLVLFYHAHFSIIASGFIGVDIFFVISGFLITHIILTEIENTQKFRFINFYKKRLWRLMPVLLALVVVTAIVCYRFYLPVDLIDFAKSAKSTLLFQSNQYFSNIVGGYFSNNINTLPLLHTWSLSIEWQWYFILPFILLGLTKVVQKRFIPIAIMGLWCAALILVICLSALEPTRNYYFLSARAFELLTGSVVAVLPFNNIHVLIQRKLSNTIKSEVKRDHFVRQFLSGVGILALSTLGVIALKHDVLIGFPNYYALMVCLATASLIVIGQINPDNTVTRFLSFKPLVGIGLISYSLYIWHWPIFATIRYIPIEETPIVTAMCLMLAFVLGVGSWYFLERPARRFNQTKTWVTVVVLLIVPISLVTWGEYRTIKRHGFQNRFGEITLNITDILMKFSSEGRLKCIDSPQSVDNAVVLDESDLCLLGKVGAPRKALLIGDSFANHYWGFMDVLGKDAAVSIRSNTTAACLALPDIYLLNKSQGERVYKECRDNTARYYEYIKNNHYDYVILGQVWSRYLLEYYIVNHLDDEKSSTLSLERLRAAIELAIVSIIDSGARPIIFDESFLDPKNGDNQCFYKTVKLDKKLPETCDIEQNQGSHSASIPALLAELQSKYPRLIVIDPKTVQCPQGKCLADIDNIPLYTIQSHLNDFASYKMGEQYLELTGNPFKIPNFKVRSQDVSSP